MMLLMGLHKISIWVLIQPGQTPSHMKKDLGIINLMDC